MGVYASTSDQVLLGVLWAVRDLSENVSEPLLEEIVAQFQNRSGMILYGPIDAPDADALHRQFKADLSSLQRRGMIARTPNPHARVTMVGAPIADALVLPAPLDELVALARARLS